jgi:hypothetical protein
MLNSYIFIDNRPVFEQYRDKPLFGLRQKLEKSWGEYMWTTYG